MNWIIQGKTLWKFGDNFNADIIVGTKYMTERDPEVLAKACLADFEPEFYKKVNKGDIMVAGNNFGYGHPHDQGVIAMQALGISTLIAESFYPTFYRMAIYRGFPLLACPGIINNVNVGDDLEVNLQTGMIKNLSGGGTIQGEELPTFLREIVESKGQINLLRIKYNFGGR